MSFSKTATFGACGGGTILGATGGALGTYSASSHHEVAIAQKKLDDAISEMKEIISANTSAITRHVESETWKVQDYIDETVVKKIEKEIKDLQTSQQKELEAIKGNIETLLTRKEKKSKRETPDLVKLLQTMWTDQMRNYEQQRGLQTELLFTIKKFISTQEEKDKDLVDNMSSSNQKLEELKEKIDQLGTSIQEGEEEIKKTVEDFKNSLVAVCEDEEGRNDLE